MLVLPSWPTPPAPTDTTQPGACVGSSEQIVTAYSLSPRIRARAQSVQETFIEDVIEEQITSRMLSSDASPIAFAVPDGCNAVDFLLGPIEVNPGLGEASDFDEVVTVGELRVSRNGCLPTNAPLQPGEQLTVVVPWRHARWVELGAHRLRLPIYARFYQVVNA